MTGALDVTSVAVFCRGTTGDEAAALVRRAVVGLLTLPGVSFFSEKDRAILERPDGLAPEWTKKPVFLTDNASSHGVILHHFWRPGVAYHYLVMSPDSDVQSEELGREWKALTERMERMLGTLNPDVAVAFAQRPEAESDPINYGEICPVGRKRVLAPWTYFRSDSLDTDAKQRLGALPGVSTKPVASGFVITVVARPGIAPDREFAKAVEAFDDLDYVDPLLVEP